MVALRVQGIGLRSPPTLRACETWIRIWFRVISRAQLDEDKSSHCTGVALSFALLLAWSCIFCLPPIYELPSHANLFRRFYLAVYTSHRLATVSACSLRAVTPFPNRFACGTCGNSLHFLLNTSLPLIVRSEFIKKFRRCNRVVLETLAIWEPTFWLGLTDTRKVHACLGPPLIEASATVGCRQFDTAFSLDHLNVIGTCAIASHKILLFLVPCDFRTGAFLCSHSLVPREIKRCVLRLLGKCFAIPQGVPEFNEPQYSFFHSWAHPFWVFAPA
jgi:hypothetical protein